MVVKESAIDIGNDFIPFGFTVGIREPGWRPLFGQEGAAETHLANQGVGTGDVFLFFGLFRPVEKAGDGWRYVRGSRPRVR